MSKERQPRRRTFAIQGQSDDFESFYSSASLTSQAMLALIKEVQKEKVLYVQKTIRAALRLIAEPSGLRSEVYLKNTLSSYYEELSKALRIHRSKFNIKTYCEGPLEELAKYKEHELLKDDTEALALIEECFEDMDVGQYYHSEMVYYANGLYDWELANARETVEWFQPYISDLGRKVEEAYGKFSGCLTKVFDNIVSISSLLAYKSVNLQ